LQLSDKLTIQRQLCLLSVVIRIVKSAILEFKKNYTEQQLSSLHVSGPEQTVGQIKNLFFIEQLQEEKILLELYSPNSQEITQVNPNRLHIDLVFSKRQLQKKRLFGWYKWQDSAKVDTRFSVDTILTIKNEQKALNTTFKSFYVLVPRLQFFSKHTEPLLFTCIGDNIYYLINQNNSTHEKKSILNSPKFWTKIKTFLTAYFK
jgi:hypothetical protein